MILAQWNPSLLLTCWSAIHSKKSRFSSLRCLKQWSLSFVSSPELSYIKHIPCFPASSRSFLMFFVLMARGSQYLLPMHAPGPTRTDCWRHSYLEKKIQCIEQNVYLCCSFWRIKGNARILCLYSVRLEGDGTLRRLFFWKFIKLQGHWNQAYDG